MTDLLVIGTGLIGTSVGLALRESGEFRVLLHDSDSAARDAAVARGAGEPWDGHQAVDLVLASVPPRASAPVLREVQSLKLARTYTHVSSVQSQVQREVESLDCDLSSVVGGHPLAGRESSGPGAASGDLFVGRPWALCPSIASSAQALEDVRALALACGATPLVVGAQEHDEAVALLSHLPQVASSALAALLVPAGADQGAPGDQGDQGDQLGAQSRRIRTELSGTGLVDTTRLAASAPALWTEILVANAAQLAPDVRALAGLLSGLAGDLECLAAPSDPQERAQALAAVTALLVRGNHGRALVPVKRGVRDEGFARVGVEVDDRPGRLAALLTAAGEAGVNVEDVRVDHVPGRPRGVIELLVATAAATPLEAALRERGWALRQSD